jgi:hypothetical protein
VEVSGELQAYSSLLNPVFIEWKVGWGGESLGVLVKDNSLLLSTFNPRTVQPTAWPFSDWELRINKHEQCKLHKRSNRNYSSNYSGVWLNKFSKMVGEKTRKANVRINITPRRVGCVLEKKLVLRVPSVVCVALGIQHVTRIGYVLLSCPNVPYFSTLSHKRHDFRENVIEHKMCILIFSTISSEKFSH